MTTKQAFFADLRARIAQHQAAVDTAFVPLSDAQLAWQPAANEWSVLQCLDHLNQTHRYYQAKIGRALTDPVPVTGDDSYRPSGWGGVYMAFALNPRFSFPVPDAIAPGALAGLTRETLTRYLAAQDDLLRTLDACAGVDLRATRIPIEKSVRFNLGDCLRILVYHDALHMRQARGVLAAARFPAH